MNKLILSVSLLQALEASPVQTKYFQGSAEVIYSDEHSTARRRLKEVTYFGGRPMSYASAWPKPRTAEDYKPIRILPYFIDANIDNIEDKDYLEKILLPETVEFLSHTLSVVRASGNLTVPQECKTGYFVRLQSL
jgi:hypothetical protein